MNSKKEIQSRIRGWFPKEPKLPTQTIPIRRFDENRYVARLGFTGIVLMVLSLILFFVLPLPYYVTLFHFPRLPIPFWADISQGLGLLTAFLASLYVYQKQKRMKNNKSQISNFTQELEP